jgi:transcriptional regulator with XRE-family HTH domain
MGVSTTSAAVGLAIRSKRKRANVPLDRVARQSHISAMELQAIESGRSRPSIAILDRIARALGSTLVELVAGSDGAPSSNGAPDSDVGTGTAAARLGLADIAWAVIALPPSSNGRSKLDSVEAATVLVALRTCKENQSAAARLLGMERKAFVRRLGSARRSGIKLGPASSARPAE